MLFKKRFSEDSSEPTMKATDVEEGEVPSLRVKVNSLTKITKFIVALSICLILIVVAILLIKTFSPSITESAETKKELSASERRETCETRRCENFGECNSLGSAS